MEHIVISGNIGSGKSTLLNLLRERLNKKEYTFIDEPVNVWKSIKDRDGINALQHYYNDPRKNAYNLQMLSLITRIEELKKANQQEGKIFIGERCLFEDREIFAKLSKDDGFISGIEYETYKYYFKAFKIKKPTKIFYITTQPQECLKRIQKRGRPEEADITLEYLNKLHRYYADWLCDGDTPVIFLNGNETPSALADRIINNHFF
jgi:deoxyadenosine/deoxycytidine kinase